MEYGIFSTDGVETPQQSADQVDDEKLKIYPAASCFPELNGLHDCGEEDGSAKGREACLLVWTEERDHNPQERYNNHDPVSAEPFLVQPESSQKWKLTDCEDVGIVEDDLVVVTPVAVVNLRDADANVVGKPRH
ncbi:MAG: hypothetical protein COV59_00405 [Candidatus Magasanikbacteria bacterium CG11_big_fil_rev_8_21_14_0_20_39_34]|uniref:Uncharacterized protein n=1 Tax=Candidatus Magasanikbacteria bacterium CG11_big_fil_rev_8_21_14_0_20_39_34 TaxID=1974653 RepID=A0A2H0N6Q3_9BACT|nr:MAG: hypothetical protein COV59_00405 [Candidatus Magasanikbacteria bacterium CG11_big_fil_rev_8_21_14_0_20_39_34]